MKNSVLVLLGGFVLVSVAQPSQSPLNNSAHLHLSACMPQRVGAEVIPRIDQRLYEWIGEGNAISIVASGSDKPRFSIRSTQKFSNTCQRAYTGL